MRSHRVNLLLIIIAVLVSSCASTGQMQGTLSAPGQKTGPVVFDFKSDKTGEGGMLSTKLPTGEFFSGQYTQVASAQSMNRTVPLFRSWDPYWSNWGPYGAPYGPASDYQAFRTYYSRKAIATLSGSKGTTMSCIFSLHNPPVGLSGGGSGECRLSTGGTIDVAS